MKTLLPAFAAALALAACSNETDDVVEQPAAGAPVAPVTETRAQTAQNTAAVALGMTREQLEDADLLSLTNTKLGEVESIVVDTAGAPTGLVIDLEGPGGDVIVPMSDVQSIRNGDDVDVSTGLSATQLQGLPAYREQR